MCKGNSIVYKGKTGEKLIIKKIPYVIRVEDFDNVPRNLRDKVRDLTKKAFEFIPGLIFDYNRRYKSFDVTVHYSSEIPIWGAFGEHSRGETNQELWGAECTIYVGLMQAMRLALPEGGYEEAFENTDASLGSMIANTAVHEIGHALGHDKGGVDGGGHVKERNNYLWDGILDDIKKTTRVDNGLFEYTVVSGDTLSGIVSRWKRGELHPCARGATALTYMMVWETVENRNFGFIAHPTKSDVKGRKANDPDWIYPGEKILLGHKNYRTQDYRKYYPGWLGEKIFSDAQKKEMKSFVHKRLQTISERP